LRTRASSSSPLGFRSIVRDSLEASDCASASPVTSSLQSCVVTLAKRLTPTSLPAVRRWSTSRQVWVLPDLAVPWTTSTQYWSSASSRRATRRSRRSMTARALRSPTNELVYGSSFRYQPAAVASGCSAWAIACSTAAANAGRLADAASMRAPSLPSRAASGTACVQTTAALVSSG
jgi:hypothetical protein